MRCGEKNRKIPKLKCSLWSDFSLSFPRWLEQFNLSLSETPINAIFEYTRLHRHIHRIFNTLKINTEPSIDGSGLTEISYRREIALPGGLVLLSKVEDWKWETIFMDIIGLSSTTVTQMTSKAVEFGEKTQYKGYYAVQGHSRSSRLVPIENPYATSY